MRLPIDLQLFVPLTTLTFFTCVAGFFMFGHKSPAKEQSAFWYGLFILISIALGSLCQVIITFFPNLNPSIILYMKFILSSVSYRFSPYTFLMANVAYNSNFLSLPTRKKLKLYLLIPIVITYLLDLIFYKISFSREYLYSLRSNPLFIVTVIYSVAYVIFGFILTAFYTFKEVSRTKIIQRVSTIILNTVILFITLLTYKVIELHPQVFPASIGFYLLYFFLITFMVIRYSVFGYRINIESVDLNKKKIEELFSVLTETEKEVANLKLEGHSNNQIAKIRGVSLSTIKTHINTIFKKISIKDFNALADKIRQL